MAETVIEQHPAASSILAFVPKTSSKRVLPWRTGLLSAVVSMLYLPTLRLLVDQWYHNADYSYAFLIPVLSLYLMWRKRHSFSHLPDIGSWWGLVLVVAAAGLLFIGELSADLFSTRIALWVSIVGLTAYFRGWKTVRVLAFPLSFLLLAIPVPTVLYNEIVFPLQLLASRFASFVLDQTGVVQVLREGNLLILPNMTLQVVDACSGIRSLMSLLALAVGYSYLAEGNFLVRALLVAATVPLAILSNGCRVISAATLSYYWGPRMAEGFLHSFSGWVIFMVATALLISWHGVLLTASKLATRASGPQ